MTFKFNGWPHKTIGHLFFVTHASCIISKPSVNSNWSYSRETLNSGQNQRFFTPCELLSMTLKNNRAHLLCYCKLCVSFHSHRSIQTGVTVRKRSIWVKIRNVFCPVWLWYLNRWPWKTIAHIFYVTLSFVHHFIVIGVFKLESQPGNTQIGARFVLTSVTLTLDFWLGTFAWTSLLSMVIAPENKWWYDGRNIVQKVSDGRTDRSFLRVAWLQLKIVLGTIFVESQWFIRTIRILKGHFP